MKIKDFSTSLIKDQNRLKTLLLILAILLISGVAHGYNMFRFPYYENDEGVYLSQTWSIIKKGQLAPYTYWYDHAPAGWIAMVPWVKLTGGFFTFGPAINSGRVFMLVLHLATTWLLFSITKKLSGSNFSALVATLIFSLSPLAVYFQRRVLLDNIMIFWILTSFSLLLTQQFRLSSALLSALTFGIAVLTKESAIFLLPAFVYTIYSRPYITNRRFTLIQWLTVSGLTVSTYFLYAALQGELMPIGFWGDSHEHVSLISSLIFQFRRGAGLPFWKPESDFYLSLGEWVSKDAFTVVLGAAATILSTILAIRSKSLRVPALFALLFWIFLMRGDLIINFYVIPAIPLLALNLGVLLEFLFKNLSGQFKQFLRVLSLSGIILGLFYLTPLNPYVRDETEPQIQAINWVKKNLAPESHIIIDNYAFIDLRESRFPGDKAFPNADWFWKLDYDPAIREQKYQQNWYKIEYIVLSHEMIRQMKLGTQKMLRYAFENSHPVMEWKEQSIAFLDLSKLMSTNGDWAAIFKMNDEPKVALNQSWEYFKKNFIINYGQVIDPVNTDITTSEGQAYTMLRAVWEDDQGTFNNLWQWTKDHLQHRNQDKLLSWSWVKEGNEYKLGDFASAADADEDIALALLFAHKKWKEDSYLDEAKEIINDIWKQEVREINGRYYLISGTDKKEREGYLINPSYFSPATYKIFAEVDKTHPWKKLADNSYQFLNTLGQMSGNQTYLPKNWVIVDEGGTIKSASQYVQKEPDFYGYDAFRTMWRVALDALWFKDSRAKGYLKKIEPFFLEKWKGKGRFAAVYDLQGKEKTNYNSLSTDAGALSVISITNPELSQEIFQKFFANTFNYKDGCWDNPKDYYDQSWGWFGSALYSRQLPNLWSSPPLFKF
ncbi:MAG TPA: glycosyl hydrolase family 8 [Clostridia bacterium]|nr:glycosyl hydrolase family 8 [Clostridia bacterium]